MKEYPKIESLYDRDEQTHKFIIGNFRLPEFVYLYDNQWLLTEKVDGTNIRVGWDGERVTIGGRTDRASIPTFLLNVLAEKFVPALFEEGGMPPCCLYGEGYGAKIQKGGGNYIPDGVDFVLFDVLVGEWWLRWNDIVDVARKLTVKVVPLLGNKSLEAAEVLVAGGFSSAWGEFPAEGLVCRPQVDLRCRNGDRVIVKLKTKDFGR